MTIDTFYLYLLFTVGSATLNKILQGGEDIELSPQKQQIRKLQHELVEQHNLTSESVGEGEQRHLKIVGGQN